MNIFQPRAGISILRMRKSVASAKCVDFITPSSYPSAPPPIPLPPSKTKTKNKAKQNKTKTKSKIEEVKKTYFQSNLNLWIAFPVYSCMESCSTR